MADNVLDPNNSEEVTEAAVMQCLSECDAVQEYYDSAGGSITIGEILDLASNDRNLSEYDAMDIQIIRDYVNTHDESIRDYQILDCSLLGDPGEFEGHDVGRSVLVCNPDSEDYYVAYNGTQGSEWIDDGHMLYERESIMQGEAVARFNDYVNDYGLSAESNIIVTGHSKGGNNAMYVTMQSSNADLIDRCIALDPPGFSNSAVQDWVEQGYYDARRSRITMVSGDCDYVHPLGNCIVPECNRYIIGVSAPGIVEAHAHYYLFQMTEDGSFRSQLNGSSEQTPLINAFSFFMCSYMTMSDEDIAESAPTVMALLQRWISDLGDGTRHDVNGRLEFFDITGLFSAIDNAGIRSILTFKLFDALNQADLLTAALRDSMRLQIIENLMAANISMGLPDDVYQDLLNRILEGFTISEEFLDGLFGLIGRYGTRVINIIGTLHSNRVRILFTVPWKFGDNPGSPVSGGSNKQILINKEALAVYADRAGSAFDIGIKGIELAQRTDGLDSGLDLLDPIRVLFVRQSEETRYLLQSIIDVFSATDADNKRKAESM